VYEEIQRANREALTSTRPQLPKLPVSPAAAPDAVPSPGPVTLRRPPSQTE